MDNLSLQSFENTEVNAGIENILIYSTDADECMGLGMSLEHQYKLFFALHGDTLLTFVQALQPDLLIYTAPPSAWVMHEFEIMKYRNPHLRIMLITDPRSGNTGLLRRFRTLIDTVLTKPVSCNEIHSAIGALSTRLLNEERNQV